MERRNGMDGKERKGKENWITIGKYIYIYIFRGNGKEGMRKRKEIIWIIYETRG